MSLGTLTLESEKFQQISLLLTSLALKLSVVMFVLIIPHFSAGESVLESVIRVNLRLSRALNQRLRAAKIDEKFSFSVLSVSSPVFVWWFLPSVTVEPPCDL